MKIMEVLALIAGFIYEIIIKEWRLILIVAFIFWISRHEGLIEWFKVAFMSPYSVLSWW